jgi:hypothetical protein
MPNLVAHVRQHCTDWPGPLGLVRIAVVVGCALTLILAAKPLPF